MMDLMPWRPYEEISRVSKDLERLWNTHMGEAGWSPDLLEWMPSVDISETEDAFVVKADLPGLDAENVDIQVTGDLLTLRGEKTQEAAEEGKSHYFRERRFGAFQRALPLPAEVDRDHVDATYKDGVLTIRLQKSERSKRKRIEVKTS